MNKWLHLFGLLLVCTGTFYSSILAQPVPSGYYFCKYTPVAPQIDGLPNDAVWSSPQIKKDTLKLSPTMKDAFTTRKVWFQSAYDKDYLYFFCYADNKELWNVRTGRDVSLMFRENAFEWFLSPNTTSGSTLLGKDYLELQANTQGNVADYVCYTNLVPSNPNLTVEGLKIATKLYGTFCPDSAESTFCNRDIDTGWAVEIAIPFSVFNTKTVLSNASEYFDKLKKADSAYVFTDKNIFDWDSLLQIIKKQPTNPAAQLLNSKIDQSLLTSIKAATSKANLTDQMKTHLIAVFANLVNDINLYPSLQSSISFTDTVIAPDTIPNYPLNQFKVEPQITKTVLRVDTIGRYTTKTGKVRPVLKYVYKDTVIYLAPKTSFDSRRYLIDNGTFLLSNQNKYELKSNLQKKDSLSITWFNFLMLQEMLYPTAIQKYMLTPIDMIGTNGAPLAMKSWLTNVYMCTSPLDSMYRINYIWANGTAIGDNFHAVNQFGRIVFRPETLVVSTFNKFIKKSGKNLIISRNKNQLSIKSMDLSNSVEIELLTANGSLVMREMFDSKKVNNFTINLKSLSKGAYFLRLKTGSQILGTEKVFVHSDN